MKYPVMKFIAKWVLDASMMALLLYHFVGGITLGTAAAVATIFSIIGYFVGDQVILRASNNIIATVADGVMSIVFLWIVAASFGWDLSFGENLVISGSVAAMEWVIHRYIFQPVTFVVGPEK